MSVRIGTTARDGTAPVEARFDARSELALRGGAALAAALLTVVVPSVAIVLLFLLALVYAAAAGLFLATAQLRGGGDRAQVWRQDMNDLQGGTIGRIWPAAAALVLLAVLTA